MKKIFKFLCIAIINITLTNCVNNNIPDNALLKQKSITSIIDNKKALVIFSSLLYSPGITQQMGCPPDWLSPSTIWVKKDIVNAAFGYYPEYNDCYGEFQFNGFVIDPGTYKLDEIVNFTSTYDKIITHTIFVDENMLSFSVKGGEFLYLGELYIKVDEQNKIKLYLKDRFDQFNMTAPTKFPELYNKLQKRLFF